MSCISSFPSEISLLYHSNPTEFSPTENAAQVSTAGQWVRDMAFPREGNLALLHSPLSLSSGTGEWELTSPGSQRLAASATSSIPDPIPLPRSTLGQEVTACTVTTLWLHCALSSLCLTCVGWDPGAAFAELVKVMSWVRLIVWKWKAKSLGETGLAYRSQRNAANVTLLCMCRIRQ